MKPNGIIAVAPGAATALPVLRRRLECQRVRWRLRAMVSGTVLSLVAALAVLCGLEGLTLVSVATDAPIWFAAANAHPPIAALWVVGVVFIGALAVAALVAFLVTPNIAALARATDRELALQERLSTALEVDARPRSAAGPDPVRSALLADAERCAALVDPQRLVRFTLPRASWAVPVLIGVAVMLPWLPPDAFGVASQREAGAASRPPAGATPETLDRTTAGNLRRIAELLAKDADARSDPYLRSVARTLERLSAEVERAAPERGALAQELDRLLLNTQQAYAQGALAGNRPSDRAAALPEAARLLREARDELNGQRQAASAAPPEAGTKAQVAAAASEPADRRRASPRATPNGEPPGPSAQLPPPGAADSLKDLDAYDLADVDPRLRAERAFAEEQRRQRAANATAAGAAADAGKGEGDRAGDGTRPFGQGDATAGAELPPGPEFVLPEAANDGRRIRIELTPEAQLSDVAPPSAAATGAWRRVPEQPVDRPALDAENRKVVGRYFARAAEGRRP